MTIKLYTWGYRDRTLEDLLAIIKQHGIRDVHDVRRNPDFRVQRGWRAEDIGGPISRACCGSIDSWKAYHVAIELGNQGKTAKWKRGPGATYKLLHVATLMLGFKAVLLLCAERDAAECHRTEVAEALRRILAAAGVECEVKHL